MEYFSYIPKDQIIKIALNLDIKDIGWYCQVNQQFNNLITNNFIISLDVNKWLKLYPVKVKEKKLFVKKVYLTYAFLKPYVQS